MAKVPEPLLVSLDFIANPDLPERIRLGARLNVFDRATSYGGGARGYTDYPTLEMARVA